MRAKQAKMVLQNVNKTQMDHYMGAVIAILQSKTMFVPLIRPAKRVKTASKCHIQQKEELYTPCQSSINGLTTAGTIWVAVVVVGVTSGVHFLNEILK